MPAMTLTRTLFFTIALGLQSVAGAADPSAGFEYERVHPSVPTETGDKVEVLELFWYGCPHCYHLEPDLKAWLERKPESAELRRMPAVLNPGWEVHARAFYTAEALGVLEQMHVVLFDRIQEKKQPLKDEDSLAKVFAEQGVAEEDFRSTFRSFFVDAKVRRAKDLTRRYGIQGVPSMIVNGKYRTNGTIAGGRKEMMEVVDYLVAVESRPAPSE